MTDLPLDIRSLGRRIGDAERTRCESVSPATDAPLDHPSPRPAARVVGLTLAGIQVVLVPLAWAMGVDLASEVRPAWVISTQIWVVGTGSAVAGAVLRRVRRRQVLPPR